MKLKFKQNDVVTFTIGNATGTGIIMGISTIGLPTMAETFIVQIIQSKPKLPNRTYPYKCITVFESDLKKVNKEEQHITE